MSRTVIAGATDYTHQSFVDILDDLHDWLESLFQVMTFLTEKTAELNASDYWQKNVTSDFAYALKFYNTSIAEITEILNEIQVEVEMHHVTRTSRLGEKAHEINLLYGEIWHRGDVIKDYGIPEFGILERIYSKGRNMAVDMMDLANLAERLEDFVGRKGKKSSTEIITESTVNGELGQCLKDFAYFIQSEKRMTFWQTEDSNKKWIRRPEAHAKDLLQTYLSGRYGDKIVQLEEIRAGAGKIDIFVIWSDGERAVIELKMCGYGYSFNYAKEGREQLIHYMENKKAQNGYLVVFDSRVNDFSQSIPVSERVKEMEISAICIDVRPYVKQKDAPTNM